LRGSLLKKFKRLFSPRPLDENGFLTKNFQKDLAFKLAILFFSPRPLDENGFLQNAKFIEVRSD